MYKFIIRILNTEIMSEKQDNKDDLSPDESGLVDRWKTIRDDYRKRYPDITDDDVKFESGDFDLMTERIAKRTNRSPDDIAAEIRHWRQ